MNKTLGLYLSVFQEPISMIDKVVLNYLLNSSKRKYWSIADTASKLGCTEKTVSNSLKSLESKGYILREKPEGKRYYLTRLTSKALKVIGCTLDPEAAIHEVNEFIKDGESINDLFNKVMSKESYQGSY